MVTHRLTQLCLMTSSMFLLFNATTLEGYCSKCVKIEAEREKEKAIHPQPTGYYDDAILNKSNREKQFKEKEQRVEKSNVHPIDSPEAKSQTLSFSSQFIQKNNTFLASNANERPLNVDFFEEDEIDGAPRTLTTQSSPLKNEKLEIKLKNRSPLPYSTLYTILKTKNFLETLSHSFTLFIPTNEALKRLSPKLLEGLNRPENGEKLASIVSNHVVARKLLNKDFVNYNELEIKAISGKNLTLSVKDGQFFIDGIKILGSEPAGSDGIIYLIEDALYP